MFSSSEVGDAEDVIRQWEMLKTKEKDGNKRVLSGVPDGLPPLLKAYRMQDKARGVGFDWECKEQVWDKVKEELAEVEAEMRSGSTNDLEGEIGDLFFALINACRLYGIDPENALERTNLKFISRFNHVEKRVAEQGKMMNETPLDELESYWQEAKHL